MKKHENMDYFRDILDGIIEIEAFVKGLDYSNFKQCRYRYRIKGKNCEKFDFRSINRGN
jgi:hypothetical protein